MTHPFQFRSRLNLERHLSVDIVDAFHESTNLTQHSLAAQVFRSHFHLNDRDQLAANALNFKRYPTRTPIYLPQPQTNEVTLNESMRLRRSVREFERKTFQLQDLSNILYRPLIRDRKIGVHEGVSVRLASYPSGGGLYPVETYIVPINIEGLEFGAFHFDAINGALRLVTDKISHAEFSDALVYPRSQLGELMCVVVQTAILERSTLKYGNRGYRFALLEAGHAAQNVLLSCAAHGVGGLPWGSVLDHDLGRLLTLNPTEEVVIHSLLIGKERVDEGGEK